ncbi:type II CAAX endopeptidase family protein [Lachnospiraceae bacterium 45-W7]
MYELVFSVGEVNTKGFKHTHALSPFMVGIVLGITAKFADGREILYYFPILADIMGQFGIWVWAAALKAIGSRTPLPAATRSPAFFAGMLMAYYGYTVLLFGILSEIAGGFVGDCCYGYSVLWFYEIVPLIMTTFFEEFLFRGFVQGRIEQQFGWIPVILVSGAMFSLYHLGYPGFRTWEDILLLFAVGIGFAAAYKLSDHNLLVSYFVNLPNAFVTYMLKYEQFPVMGVSSTIAASVTLVLIGLLLLFCRKADWMIRRQ